MRSMNAIRHPENLAPSPKTNSKTHQYIKRVGNKVVFQFFEQPVLKITLKQINAEFDLDIVEIIRSLCALLEQHYAKLIEFCTGPSHRKQIRHLDEKINVFNSKKKGIILRKIVKILNKKMRKSSNKNF
ncbi:hypothetical protein MHBO_000124 [Bonamia ostreae]|uniref:LAGLIDADG homing endonuclease n=1 Tax=Bonamia ostreae TaxID=126728 RepID=A0ABV2AEJ5_9EUKA